MVGPAPPSSPGGAPPGIPPGFSIYLHGWMNDPGGPAGAAATNALELITP